MGYYSLAHRVLSIPELLELVFDYLDAASNVSNACVSKSWSQIALDNLWRDVNDIRRLFSLLAPMPKSGSIFNFERMVEPSDWYRFCRYARRVRRFHYDDHGAEAVVSIHALEEIAQTRTTLSVLPNLRDFTWITAFPTHQRFSVLFMNENVRSFTFFLEFDNIFPRQPFFQDVVTRMPFLTQLDMRTNQRAKDIEADFIGLLSGLPKLQKVVLPLYHITSKVMEELAKIDNLGTIQFEFLSLQGRGSQDDLQVFNPTLVEGAFPALWDLSISVHLPHFTNFVKEPFAPTHLTSIYVHAISTDGEAAVHEFFSAIADNCPLLEALYLECLPGSILSTQWNVPTSEFEQLTLNTLKPLHDCPKLRTFELMYPTPLDLTMDDLEELTKRWPSLEVISLNAEPVLQVDVRSNLTLRAILPFVRNCPNLRKLGLFIDATAADIPAPVEVPRPFVKLAELRVGVSSIVEVGPIALFLSRVCPVGCSIMTGVSWPYLEMDSPISSESADTMVKWYELWDEVNKYLPLLTRLRMEEREMRRELQEEVEDLRTRNNIMTEKAQLALSGDGDDSCVVA